LWLVALARTQEMGEAGSTSSPADRRGRSGPRFRRNGAEGPALRPVPHTRLANDWETG